MPTPAEIAAADQVAAHASTQLDKLIAAITGELRNGLDPTTAYANVAMFVSDSLDHYTAANLLAAAVLRLVASAAKEGGR